MASQWSLPVTRALFRFFSVFNQKKENKKLDTKAQFFAID